MKARVLVGFLVVFALWPLVHRGLVEAYDVNPWKLGGWAMYTAPAIQVQLVLVGALGDKAVRIPPDKLSGDTRYAYDVYFKNIRHLGRLVSPDAVARGVLKDVPELREVMFVVVRRHISPRTGLIEVTDERYVYERSKMGITF